MMSEEESDFGGHRGDVDLTTDQEQVKQGDLKWECRATNKYQISRNNTSQ